MNFALAYLWLALLKGRLLRFGRGLRRPTTLIGFAALLALFGFLFYHRRHELFGHLVERRWLIGGGFLMVFGSVFKGFLQRGLAFEPPDTQFLFTSPFSRRQILCYRLFSDYLYAVLQGLVFLVLFASHLKHPLLAAACLMLFQAACFHVAMAASIYAGTISEQAHHRIKCMILGSFALLTALYLRAAWDLRLVPSAFASPLAQLLFYPAANLPDAVSVPWLHIWTAALTGPASGPWQDLGRAGLVLCLFAGAAGGTLWWLLRSRGDLYEPALSTTTRQAERRLRREQGRVAGTVEARGSVSFRLPRLRCFRGAGAIVWKHLVVARRSKGALLIVCGFAFLYTGFTTALLYVYHYYSHKYGAAGPGGPEAEAFHLGIALFLAALTLFLQRMVPFDLRRDGHHLADLRTLPVAPLRLALAEITVPVGFCLALQAPCILALVIYAPFSWVQALLVVLAYPAVALALNIIWNLYYFITAARRGNGESGSPSAVGAVIVVALSFLVFYPATWTALHLGHGLNGAAAIQTAFGAGLAVQYTIDLLLVLILARLFQRVEVTSA